MPSPFPGMDPYLETPNLWPDVHHGLISEIRAVLNLAVRPRYVVRVALREYISDDDTLRDNEIKEARLEVLHLATGSVATVIEVLKHTNKVRGAQGRVNFLANRQAAIAANANWVEIDLLRDGLPSTTLPPLKASDYHIIIRRAGEAEEHCWPIDIQQPLPVIGIPLRVPDTDVPVDLGEVLRSAYERGAYDRSVDYREQPDPPLSTKDKAWAHRLLR